MALSAGSQLGRYEIRSLLGAGGMGEVYLANDTQLKRAVALKVLSPEFIQNKDRLRRFEQEAYAIAALSHPNIAHIYEIGESDGTRFIAMEYIDGVTLHEKIHRDKTALRKLLKYLAQVAEGLAKAHAAGIVHRDLKPENIMIARDDYAKILDFGLVKLVEPQVSAGSENDASGETTATLLAHSTPGMIMGTAGYMSPEQAQGRIKEIDHRSDIFSFGCVLYEAATRYKAFEGKDQLDSLHKIVHAPTPRIKDINAAAPDDLQRIVRRCLAKEPDKRYQSIKDVTIELDEIRQELKDKAGLEYSVQPNSTSEPVISTLNAATDISPALTTEEAAHSASSAEYLVSGIKTHRKSAVLAFSLLIIALGGVGFAIYEFGWPGTSAALPVPFQAMKIERLTSNGKATQAVISPDGKQVVYVIDDGGKRSLWLRQVATATDIQLTAPDNSVFYWSLTISRDGNFLYYIYGGTIRNRMLYQMPLLGGSPKKLIDDISSPIGFSPDGKQIAFVRSRPEESSMMIANADGTGEREIAKRPGQQSFGSFFGGGVAWSPDGTKIVSVANDRDAEGRFQNVMEITIEDGTVRPIGPHRFYEIHRLALLADGSGVLVTAAEKASEFRSKQIWYLPYSGGEGRKITQDLNNYTSMSLTADSSVLVTVQEDEAANIWVGPDGDSARATQISSVSGKMDGYDGVAWTPDGRIVYTSMAGGNEAIWIMDADGKNRKQLSLGESADFGPSVSTDGRYIVFTSERGRQRSVWRMDLDGNNRKQLSDRGGGIPQATAEWVVFGDVWKVPIDGGEPVRIIEERGVNRCAISPDGKLLACQFDPLDTQAKIKVISVEDGVTVKDFDAKLELPARIHWAPDGRSITYVSRLEGLRDIWSQPLDGGEPKRLTNFKADQIFSFNWSRDNKLVISHGISASDVVLLRNLP